MVEENGIMAFLLILVASGIACIAFIKVEKKRIKKNYAETEAAITSLKRRHGSPIILWVLEALEKNQNSKDPVDVIEIINKILPIKVNVPASDSTITDVIDMLIDADREFENFLVCFISTVKGYKGKDELILSLRENVSSAPNDDELKTFAEKYWPNIVLESHKDFISYYWIWEHLDSPPCLRKRIIEEINKQEITITKKDVLTIGSSDYVDEFDDMLSLLSKVSSKITECRLSKGSNPCDRCPFNPKWVAQCYKEHYDTGGESCFNPWKPS